MSEYVRPIWPEAVDTKAVDCAYMELQIAGKQVELAYIAIITELLEQNAEIESRASNWISVDDLPKDDSTVALLFEEVNGGYTGHGYGHYSSFTDDIEVTYDPYRNTVIDYKLVAWMALPKAIKLEAPKG